jgi:RNA polymerase sigma-32 factor
VSATKSKTKGKAKSAPGSSSKGPGVAPVAEARTAKAKPKLAGSSTPAKRGPAGRSAESAGPATTRRRQAASAESASEEHAEQEGGENEEINDEVIEAEAEVVSTDGESRFDEPAPPPAAQGGGSLARLDPMQQYLREVQKHSLLSPDEEHSLAIKYAGTGDVAAAARLVTANLRLVVKIAYEYRRAYKNIMDLVQEGNIGLMQAVKRYDPYRGVKLSSYAAWWIRAYILRFILNNWRLVKLGTTQAQRKLFFNLNKEKARLSAMGVEPSAAEIARRLGVEEQEVSDMDRRLSSGEMSLDAPVGDSEGRAVSRLEMLPTSLSGPDSAVAEGEMQQIVKEKLGTFRTTLKGKDVQIFDERLIAEDPLTLQELGDKFGISRERVRQLEARLTGRLREYLKSELGDAVPG